MILLLGVGGLPLIIRMRKLYEVYEKKFPHMQSFGTVMPPVNVCLVSFQSPTSVTGAVSGSRHDAFDSARVVDRSWL